MKKWLNTFLGGFSPFHPTSEKIASTSTNPPEKATDQKPSSLGWARFEIEDEPYNPYELFIG